MNTVLSQVQHFADQAHGEQQRKFEEGRYIVHPTRVMEICYRYTHDVTILAAALLHDVLEDTDTDAAAIHRFLLELLVPAEAARTLQLVRELTDQYTKAAYPRLNRRERKAKETDRLAACSAGAQTIKYADILDNSTTISTLTNDFAPRYLKECRQLLHAMHKGNNQLRQAAIDAVEKGLSAINDNGRTTQ